VRALLHDRAAREHRDLVRVPDRRQPVRNHDGAHALGRQQRVERCLHHALRRRVERARCLVQDEDWWVAHDGARDGDALLLPARQLDAFLAHLRRKRLRQLAHKRERVCKPRRRLDLLARRARPAKRDVPADAAGEEHRLLRDETHLLPQPAHVGGADVGAVEAHLAAVDVVEALEQSDHRALAAAGGARQRDGRARLDAQAQLAVHAHVGARGVGEAHGQQLHLPARARTLPVGGWRRERVYL